MAAKKTKAKGSSKIVKADLKRITGGFRPIEIQINTSKSSKKSTTNVAELTEKV